MKSQLSPRKVLQRVTASCIIIIIMVVIAVSMRCQHRRKKEPCGENSDGQFAGEHDKEKRLILSLYCSFLLNKYKTRLMRAAKMQSTKLDEGIYRRL